MIRVEGLGFTSGGGHVGASSISRVTAFSLCESYGALFPAVSL